MPRRSTETSAPREAGAHYTPAPLADAFAAEALRVWAEPWGPLADGSHDLWERQLRVLDPACGDGELMYAVAGQLWKRLRDTPKYRCLGLDAEAMRRVCAKVFRGVELRADAAEAARARLPGVNVTCGDGLAASADGALVLMNPPWVGRSKRPPEVTARVKALTGYGTADLACAFLRAYPTAAQISAILPSACTEGDNRLAGLKALVDAGWDIRSATAKTKWPGEAKVMYVTVHMRAPARKA